MINFYTMDLNALRNLVDSENRISQAPVQEKKSLTPEELESEVQRRVEQLSSEEI